jgi:TPR repeat protein
MGAVMCRAMTGEKPPVAADRIDEDEFEWLSYRDLPKFLENFKQAVDWALRVKVQERPKSVAEFRDQLVSGGQVPASKTAYATDNKALPTAASAHAFGVASVADGSFATAQPCPARAFSGFGRSAWIAGLGFAGCMLVATVLIVLSGIIKSETSEKQLAEGLNFLEQAAKDPRGAQKALSLISRAAEQGNPETQFNLGAMYRAGKGVAQSDAEAVRWYRKAAAQGNNDATKALITLGVSP